MGARLGWFRESGVDGGARPESCLSRKVARDFALEAGFAEAGLVALPYADESRDAERFEEWVRERRAGTMGYLKRTSEDGRLLRARVGNAFPWARSAVVCFAGYESAQPRSTEAAEKGAGWIARYAWSSRADANGARRPSDYHKVLRKRLRALEENIREMRMREGWDEFEARGFVDTGPVVERALARAAGVGWGGGGGGGGGLPGKEYLPDSSSAGIVWISGCSSYLAASPRGESARGTAGSMRELPAMPGGLPDGGANGALPDGCCAVHLVFDH
jgi:hypothetical protein